MTIAKERKVVKVASAYQKAYFEKLSSAFKKYDALGTVLIQGIEADGDEDDSDEEDDQRKTREDCVVVDRYTNAQVDTLRHAFLTKRRHNAMKRMTKRITGGQDGDSCMMFNTHSGNMAFYTIMEEIEKINKTKSLPAKFDSLFGLTYAMTHYDYFLDDNEMSDPDGDGEGDIAVKDVAETWRDLLTKTDKQLGIDSEFTRPAVETMLEKFRRDIEGRYTGGYTFPWKHSPESESDDDDEDDEDDDDDKSEEEEEE